LALFYSLLHMAGMERGEKKGETRRKRKESARGVLLSFPIAASGLAEESTKREIEEKKKRKKKKNASMSALYIYNYREK